MMGADMTTEASWMRFLKADRAVYAAIVSVLAAIVLFPGVARDVVPGDPARLIARHGNIDVFAPLSHNLWGWLASAFAIVLPGTTGFRWNLFSALCGAGCCGMLVLLGARLPKLNPQWSLTVLAPRAMANLAGTAAGLLLLGSLPFRIVSSIASPVTFELLGVLVACWLLARYRESTLPRYAAGACALFSVMASQSGIAIIMAPVFIFALVVAVWRNKDANMRTAGILAALLSIPGLVVLIAVAISFSLHPSALWVGLKGLTGIFVQVARELYLNLRFGAPLLVVIVTGIYCLLPFMLTLSLTRENREGARFIFPLMLMLGALLFLNFRYAPFPLSGLKPLVIAGYAIAALWLGYLSAYLIGSMHAQSVSTLCSRRKQKFARRIANGGLAALAIFIVLAGVLSHRNVNVNAAKGLTRLASDIAGQSNTDTWLILHGELDPLVRIKAHELKRNPLIISADRITHRPYQRALAAAMPSPRLASLVDAGLAPILRERLHPDHAPAPHMAILGDPGLLRYILNTAWPDRVLYWSSEPPGLDPAAYLNRQRNWWREMPFSASDHPYHGLEAFFRTVTSRIANDAGIWLENHDAGEFAREAYREAIRIDPDNLPARLNLRELLSGETGEYAALEADIDTLSARYRGRLTLARLMDRYGMIRHESATQALDLRWNRSARDGRNDPLAEEIRKRTGDDAIVTGLLERAGNDPVVLLNYARLANGHNRPALARRILDTLPDTDPSAKAIRIERAQTAMLLGDRESARQILSAIPVHERDDPRALIILALLALETDPADCDRYMAQLEALPGRLLDLSLPMARIYEARGNREMATYHLGYLAARQPLNKEAHRNLVRHYLENSEHPSAYAAALPLLTLDTRDPWANAALAVHLENAGDFDAAAQARAIALAAEPGLSRLFK